MGRATASAVMMAMILISQCVFLISPEDLDEVRLTKRYRVHLKGIRQ